MLVPMVITLKGKCNPSQHNCQLLHECVIEKAAFQMSLEHLNYFTLHFSLVASIVVSLRRIS